MGTSACGCWGCSISGAAEPDGDKLLARFLVEGPGRKEHGKKNLRGLSHQMCEP